MFPDGFCILCKDMPIKRGGPLILQCVASRFVQDQLAVIAEWYNTLCFAYTERPVLWKSLIFAPIIYLTHTFFENIYSEGGTQKLNVGQVYFQQQKSIALHVKYLLETSSKNGYI